MKSGGRAAGRFWRLVALSTPGARLAVFGLGLAALAALGPGRLVRAPELCIYKRITGRPCYGCGMLRATAAALRGRFGEAWSHNKLVAAFLPALAAVAAVDAARLLRRRRRARPEGPGGSEP